MCSNSHFATLSHSGGSLQKFAETDGPVVLMWHVTLCLAGCSLVLGCTTSGKRDNKASNSFLRFLDNRVGLGEVTVVVTPCTLNESRHQSDVCDPCPLGGCSVVKNLHRLWAV